MSDPNYITLKMGEGRVPYKRFLKAVQAFHAILDNVAVECAGEPKTPVAWNVSVEEGSNLVHFHGEPTGKTIDVETVVRVAYTGLSDLETPERVPKHFSVAALENARKLALLAIESGEGIVIRTNGERVAVSAQTIVNADKVLSTRYQDYGSFVGQLEVLSDRRGAKVLIYDEVSGEGIKCYFPDDAWEKYRALSIQAFDEKRRVSIYGLIRYRPSGQPTRIDVEQMEALGGDDFDPLALAGMLNAHGTT